MYLVAILDRYSHDVISWELDKTMQIGFVWEALPLPLLQAKPQMCKSDQGSCVYCELVHATPAWT